MRRLAAIVLLLGASSAARAYEFSIDAETIGQGYQLRAGNDALVNRRRLTQYLGLNVYNIGPKDVYGRPLLRNQLYLSVSMRFDAEFGDFARLRELSGRSPQRDIVGERLDLLYAHIGATSLAGFLDFRLGRQLMVDLFDFRAFDGLQVQANTPFHVAVEAWGGLNVTGAAPFDSPVFRTDGIALGGNLRGSLAQRQEDALQPTFGIAVKTVGLRDVSARVSYLRTMSFTGARQPGEPGSGVTEEKVGITARGRLFSGVLIPWFGFRFNLLVGRLDELQAGVRIFASRRHALSLEYVFAAPTFDGDSIWNVFGAEAFNDARLTYDVTLGRFRLYARGFGRFFGEERTSQNGVNPRAIADLPTAYAAGGTVGARLDLGRGYARLDGYYEDGYGGTKAGVDLAGRILVFGDYVVGLSVEGRVSYVYFSGDARTIDRAHSVGVQAGLRYSFARGIALNVAMEENVNRFYASQFRVIAVLDLAFFLGPRGAGWTRPRAWGL